MTTPKNDPKTAKTAKQADLDPDSDLPPDADIEERFNDFWKKNSGGIFGGIALGALVVVGVQVFQYMGTQKEEQIQAQFAAAKSSEELTAFADANPDHQLAGVARLSVADALFEKGEFAEAGRLYADAARLFEDPTFSGRAQLGQGMSLLAAGSFEDGVAVLRAVALDRASLDQVRGEAAYHLAVAYQNAGNNEEATEALSIIDQLERASFWEMRAQELSKRLQAPAS